MANKPFKIEFATADFVAEFDEDGDLCIGIENKVDHDSEYFCLNKKELKDFLKWIEKHQP